MVDPGRDTAAEQARLYGLLLRSPGLRAEDLSARSGQPLGEVLDSLERLARLGLVTRDEERFSVISPEVWATGLLQDEVAWLTNRQHMLALVQALLPALQEEHEAFTVPMDGSPLCEVVAGDPVEFLRVMTAEATGELLWLRSDLWRYEAGQEVHPFVLGLLREGWQSRAIYPARVLEEAPGIVYERAELGERVRIMATVSTGLAVFGRDAAAAPDGQGSGIDRRVVVRHPAVVTVLRQYFDSLWDRAMTIPGFESPADWDQQDTRAMLLDQMAQGVKDEQMARTLGLSLRTVRRRVAELMDELGADSRFQAGAEAVRRGWL